MNYKAERKAEGIDITMQQATMEVGQLSDAEVGKLASKRLPRTPFAG